MTAQPAGWYPDPNDASQWRYWNGSAWTDSRSPRVQAQTSASMVPGGPAKPAPSGKWYFVVTWASAGLLAAVPFFHAASRLDRPQLRKLGARIAAGELLGCVLIGLSPTDAAGDPTGWLSNLGATVVLGVMVIATLLLIGPRREVYQSSVSAATVSGNQGAMAGVEAARRKRAEARTLAARDPMMARELAIGRPDVDRGFDDGGLLDLNHATAQQLGAVCGLPNSFAEAVVAVRNELGRFVTVEDAIVFGQVGEEHASLIRDRGIVIPDR